MAVLAKLLSSTFRVLQILGTLFNTGCLTYFIVRLANRNLISGRALAVEIISGAGLLWSIFAFVFSVCLLQKTFFQSFTVIGDALFMGGFIAVSVLLRDSWDGDCSSSNLYVPWLQRGGNNLVANCRIIKGIFITSIILSVLFFLTMLTAFLAHKSAKKDRAYGPSPANNYTSGRGKRHKNRDLESAAVAGPALVPPVTDNRVSHDSKYTDATEKTNDPALQSGTTGTDREYLAPRGYTGNNATVSPIPSRANIRSKDNSHAGQYAAAGALAGGAAVAHHQHKKNAYGTNQDGLPLHPGPEDHTTEHVPQEPERLGTMNTYGTNPNVVSQDSERLGKMNTYGTNPNVVPQDPDRLGTMNTYGTNTNSAYSELDTRNTDMPSPYHVPGAYPGSKNSIQPTAFYPASNTHELSSGTNPHYYSNEMEAGGYQNYQQPPQELGTTTTTEGARRYEEYQTPVTPLADERREEVGFGYGNGPGMTGGGSNQVSTLPELGREDGKRF
ncbi:hypothetical protein TWF225_002553 [Orbilia oligospora]|nr:hypothetical protein TWF225_002553 [Orbilia oligospora]KAF3266201.1 hypothetical protein TWF217_001879 [Orbilia oligospora]KAF3268688.1 hypothetical protein TWF128_007060 [Orbilia oligospora]KAF3297144.1 hypothetical protein TWF132_008502 [Orbilia oligospora]